MTNNQLMAREIANGAVQEVNDLPSLTFILKTLDAGGPEELERLINLDMLAMVYNLPTAPLFPSLRRVQRKLIEQAKVAKIQSGTLGNLGEEPGFFSTFTAGLFGPKTTITKTEAGDMTKTTESAGGFGGFLGGLIGMAAPLVIGLYGNRKQLEHERDMAKDKLNSLERIESANLTALKENNAATLTQNQELMRLLSQDTGGTSTIIAVGIGVGVLILLGGGAYMLLRK